MNTIDKFLKQDQGKTEIVMISHFTPKLALSFTSILSGKMLSSLIFILLLSGKAPWKRSASSR
jgi:hypothetical protein